MSSSGLRFAGRRAAQQAGRVIVDGRFVQPHRHVVAARRLGRRAGGGELPAAGLRDFEVHRVLVGAEANVLGQLAAALERATVFVFVALARVANLVVHFVVEAALDAVFGVVGGDSLRLAARFRRARSQPMFETIRLPSPPPRLATEWMCVSVVACDRERRGR